MSTKKKTVSAKLIVNPGSGRGADRGVLIEEAARSLQKLGIELDVAVVKPKEKAIPIVKKAVKKGFKLIIAMGGDDTIEAVIRGIGKSKAHLGIIPVGTANNLAKSLGIPENVQEACDLIAEGNVRKLDLGEVKVRKGKKLLFFELVVIGIGAAVYPDALRTRKGNLAKVKDVIQTVLKQDPQPKVTINMGSGGSITVETMLAIIANVPLIGPNMLVNPEASMEDGLLDLTVYPNYSKAELLSYSTKVMNESSTKDGKIQRYRAQKIKIKTSPRLDVMADGVMLGKGAVKIKVLPRALRMVAPAVGTGLEKPKPDESQDLPMPVAPVPDNNKEAALVESHA